MKVSDVEGLSGEQIAIYRHSTGQLTVNQGNKPIPLNLGELEFDLFTMVPVEDGFAPIGITGKYNPAGMITGFEEVAPGIVTLKVMDGGPFLAWCKKEPAKVLVNREEVAFEYVKKSGVLTLDVIPEGSSRITVFL